MQLKTGLDYLPLLKATLDAAIDHIQVLKAVRNEQGTITDFIYVFNNQAAEKIYGDQTGQSRHSDFETCKQVVETGAPVQREIYQGTNWYYQTIVKIDDGVSITAHNITAEHRYLTLFNNMIQAFCIIEVLFDEKGKGRDYIFLEANPVFEIQTGLTNATGRRMSELQPGFDTHWCEVYGEVIRTRKSIHFENEASALKGGTWYDVFAFPHGEPSSNQVAVFFNDITERKQHQLRQEFLLALADSLRPLSDPLAIQAVASRRIAELLHTDHAFYMEYDKLFRIQAEYRKAGVSSLVGEYDDSVFGWILPMLEKGESLMLDEVPENPLALGALIAVPFLSNGLLAGVFCVAEQRPRSWASTEAGLVKEAGERVWAAVARAHTEQALRKNEAQLKELLRLKENFISIASHELKTPVTSMKVYAEIVEGQLEELGYTEEADLIKRLNKQIDKLTTLINHLLDSSQMAGGELALNLEKTDMIDLLREKISEIQLTTSHQIRLETPELPPVMIDRERISQVLSNLFTNAIKYSPKGSAITIHGKATMNGVEISIRDEGHGIAPEDQEKIFERFFRSASTNPENYPGMGLGLYITAQIIQRHQGQISVESEPGKGATFYFTIPGYTAS